MKRHLLMALAAGIVWTGPRLTPQEAADILAKAKGDTNRTHVVYVPPGDGPRFGVTAFTPTNPAALLDEVRRLDGSRRDQPPAVYGAVPYVVVPGYGFGIGSPRIVHGPRRDR